uniref:Uncharacterized protein n=1 Tax=Lepeophtheirus salmonis TaxID=72036 RepID=A0A0K2SZJ1_LEPSM
MVQRRYIIVIIYSLQIEVGQNYRFRVLLINFSLK